MTTASLWSRTRRRLRSLRWRLALPFVVLVGVVLLVLTLVIPSRARDVFTDRQADDLRTNAETLIDVYMLSQQEGGERIALAQLVAGMPSGQERRMTLIGADGTVLADTAFNEPGQLESHGDREEVREANAAEYGHAVRRSDSNGKRYLYVALAVDDGSGQVLRLAEPLENIDAQVEQLQRFLLVTGGITLVVATGMAVLMGARLAAPMEDLRDHAFRVAEGDLSGEIGPAPVWELDAVGQSFNAMTAHLRKSLEDVGRSTSRLEAVLAGLDDSVILTDNHGCVLRLNRAAERMFRVLEEREKGRQFVQVTRDYELDALLQSALDGKPSRSGGIEHGLDRRILMASASIAMGGEAEHLGLVVIRDVTELRRLEGVRREFVANVSHELRTPLTSIRAIVDTLESGVVEDRELTADLLRRIVAETERLTSLVDDLLELAHIESGRLKLVFEPIDPLVLAKESGERLRPQIGRADLQLEFFLPEDLPRVMADRRQVEQVLVNLVHNAIKFTPPQGRITIRAKQDGDRVVLSVIDTGMGIPDDELPRLFERFYKSDKARHSHGSGLGLAIAKHIVQAHGGQLTAESRMGAGSVFSLTLLVAGSDAAQELAGDGPVAIQ